jgi:hypothetical protein
MLIACVQSRQRQGRRAQNDSEIRSQIGPRGALRHGEIHFSLIKYFSKKLQKTKQLWHGLSDSSLYIFLFYVG